MEEEPTKSDTVVMELLAIGVIFWFIALFSTIGTLDGKDVYITDIDENNAFKYSLFLSALTFIVQSKLLLTRLYDKRFYLAIPAGFVSLFAINDAFLLIYSELGVVKPEEEMTITVSSLLTIIFLLIGATLHLVGGAMGANNQRYDHIEIEIAVKG